MYYLGLFLAIVLLRVANLADATNYCDPALCTSDLQVKVHIACENTGEFSSDCNDPIIILLTPELQDVILYQHNDFRNQVANGTLPGFASAQRMATLTWDTELAYLAGLNSIRCELEHDDCHNTDAYKFSGQNLAIQYQSSTIPATSYETAITEMINEWSNQYVFANQEDIDNCSGSSLSKGINNFLEMIQDKTSKVGCGLVKFVKRVQGKNWNSILLTCNYSFSSLIGSPVYVKGPMGSACQTVPNPEFDGLCSVSESVSAVPGED